MSKILKDFQHGESLEKYVDRVIRPPSGLVRRVKNAVDQIVQYLHRMPGYNIGEIVLSGSLGKGTMVGDTGDVDLVVFFNGYKDMESFIEATPKILEDVELYMCDPSFWIWLWSSRPSWMNSIRVKRRTSFHLEFEISITYKRIHHTVHVDIRPAIDIIAQHGGMTSVRHEMETKLSNIRELYSACFCREQKEQLRPTPANVKDLIRILKHWKNSNKLPMKSYCCEVLALYVFQEKLGKKSNFDLKTGFKEAMNLLQNFEGITLTIPSFYDVYEWSQYFPKNACIMDPVNPFSAVPVKDIPRIKSIASSTLRDLDNVLYEIQDFGGTYRIQDNVRCCSDAIDSGLLWYLEHA